MTGSRHKPAVERCQWGLYVITDGRRGPGTHLEIAKAALEAGARVIQLRDKTLPYEELAHIGTKLREITRAASATFIVNDNPYLARDLDADGVHVGQGDFAVDIAREIVGPDKLVGLSTHNKFHATSAQILPIDYIGVGPVYATATKQSEWPVVGLDLIKWVREHVRLPMVAIGGITCATLPDVLAAGAQNVAIIGDLVDAPDMQARARELVEACKAVKSDDK